jgi:hypothetical protein
VPVAQAVEVGPSLTPELLQVGEASGREKNSLRDLALEQRVGADGHAVHEALDVVRGRVGLP